MRRGYWDVHFEKFVEGSETEMSLDLQVEEVSVLESRLISHGITPSKIRKLLSEYDPQRIEAQLDGLDFLVAKGGDGVPQNAAGWLVKAITEDWTSPRGFVSQAESEELARQEAEKATKQAELKKRKEDARKAADAAHLAVVVAQEEKIRLYLATLSESEQLALEREALAASPLAKGRIGPALKKAIFQNFMNELLEKQPSS